MSTVRRPRKGSLQYSPRKRSKRQYGRIRAWAGIQEPKLLGFAGYKVGMDTAIIADNKKTSMTKGQDIFRPSAFVEWPPLTALYSQLYKSNKYCLKLVSEV